MSLCYHGLRVLLKQLNVNMSDRFVGWSLFDVNCTGHQTHTKKMKIDRPPLTQPGIWDGIEWTPCVPSKQSCERRCSSLKQFWAKCFLWSVNFGWLQLHSMIGISICLSWSTWRSSRQNVSFVIWENFTMKTCNKTKPRWTLTTFYFLKTMHDVQLWPPYIFFLILAGRE